VCGNIRIHQLATLAGYYETFLGGGAVP